MLWIWRIFQTLIAPVLVRHGVFPTSADGVASAAITLTKNAAANTWGAWAEIASAAAVTVDTQITGFSLINFVGVPAQGEVQIGIGAGGAEAAIGTYDIAMAGQQLTRLILVRGATRIAARYRNANAVADTVDIKISTATGI